MDIEDRGLAARPIFQGKLPKSLTMDRQKKTQNLYENKY